MRERWATEHPHLPIIEGHDEDDGSLFNRSHAINRAAHHHDATHVDVLVIIDADVLCDAEHVRKAIGLAFNRHRLVFPFEHYAYLTQKMTDSILEGYSGSWEPGVQFRMGGTCSSVVVVPRALFEQVHGFDETFTGWGWEDVAFSLACQTLGNGFERVKGDVFHLWHPKPQGQGENTPSFLFNTRIAQRYVEAANDVAAMRALIDER